MRAIFRKIVVLGDTGTGKTALVQRFVRDSFAEEYRPTSGAVPTKATVEYEGVAVNLVIWDVAGHLFRLHPAFSSDADGAILVCDLTRSPSLEVLQKWRDLVVEKSGKIPLVVAANKTDVATMPECHGLDRKQLTIIGTSAKTGENVQALFMELVRNMMEMDQSDS